MEEELVFLEEDSDEDPLQMAFFIMPGHALKSLRDEIEIQGGESLANDMLYRYGIRCGEGMVTRMGMKCDSMEDIADTIPALWAGVGLGRITVEDVSEEHIKLRFHESVESLALGKPQEPKCHFTRGYLSGMAMGLSGIEYNVDEFESAEGWSEPCFLITKGTEYFKPVQEQAAEPTTTESILGMNLERGLAYLVENEDPDGAYKLFVDELAKGNQGLCITRDFPTKIRKTYNLTTTPVLWLSNADQEFAVEPVQLGKLYHKIEDFLKKAERATVMISGLEYLIVQNNYHSALKFLQLVRDQIAIYDGILIATISPDTLSDQDLKLIEREMEPLNIEEGG
jgi:predicted hydrocarbon binding protein